MCKKIALLKICSLSVLFKYFDLVLRISKKNARCVSHAAFSRYNGMIKVLNIEA